MLTIITYDEHGGFYEHVPASKPILVSAAPDRAASRPSVWTRGRVRRSITMAFVSRPSW